ncbi:peptide ABC transporter substrate-binding protein [Clostridiaceae bacterium M8S5]|nr:peptide ABC transporter substrate-binding protein [Clostridiaceae bacterium M8S5]
MTKKLLALLLVVVLSLSAFIVGCSNKDDEPQNVKENETKVDGKLSESEGDKQKDETEKTELDDEQIINVSLLEPKTLDPAKSTDVYSSAVFTGVMENLTRIEQDENGNDIIKPAGAEKWEVSEDGIVWTFHLRDFNWEDGKAVTAHDFEYGIKRVLAPDTASGYAFLLAPIKGANEYNAGKASADEVGVKAIDNKTLQFTLKGPCPYFEQLTYFKTMLPQRKDIVEKYGDKYGSEAEYFISCGPFKLDKWVHNSEISLAKNDAYWEADVVKLERLNYKIISDSDARYNALFNGTLDSCGVTKTEWIDKFEKEGRFVNIKGYDPSTNYQFYNQNDELFKNANIRKAFSTSITREDMADVIFHGLYTAAYSWVAPSLQLGDQEYRTLNKEEPIKMIIDENPDPKELLIKGLEELGLDPDPSKHTVTMLMSGTDDWDRTYAEYMQQMYKKKLGINMDAKYVKWDMFQKLTDDMEYQIAGMGWFGDYNDPMTFLDMFVSTALVCPTGWVNEEYDELIAKAQNEMDSSKRLEYFKKAEKILLYEDAVIAPTVFRNRNTFRAKYLKNLMSPLFGTTDFKYAYVQGKK